MGAGDGDGSVSKGAGWELRLGKWQDVLGDVGMVDSVITDPPYSERTHSGHDSGARGDGHHDPSHGHRKVTKGIGYAPWSDDDARSFVASWAPRCRGWFCVQTDHLLARVFSEALADAGRYVFAPLPIVEVGSRVRLAGDGPSSWTHWLVVSRPSTRDFQRWGTLRGAYVYTGHGDREHMGGKRSDTMRDLVRDYTRPGDLIVDPCAGAATTLLAAVSEGRCAIGSEMDPDTYAKAVKRLERGHTPPLFTDDLR